MSTSLLSFYHALPYPLRCLAASARGLQLRSWRYGKETDRLVEEALARETWSADQWSAWQAERLAHVLQRAVTKVPFYRECWENQKTENRKQKVSDLRNWPVLKKAVLRSRPEAFVAEDCDRRRMFCEHTSGTTGTPLTLWQSRGNVRQRYALFEARWRRWYGLSRHDRWAILGGQLVTPSQQMEPPFWVWNAISHQLYLSAYHVAPPNAAAYVNAMKKHRVTYLWTYSSAAHALAQFILDQNLRPTDLKAVITNAEPLYPHQRETIAKAFQCRVFETYGMAEMVCAASECLAGRMHLWPELGIAEIFDTDADELLAAGVSGRLVATGFLNADMPLVRYEIGDTVVLADPEEHCACGRRLPMLTRIDGRNDDSIVTATGRQMARFGAVFNGIRVIESQIVQETHQRIRLLVVPARGFCPADAQLLKARMKDRVGELEIIVEERQVLPRSANGKLRTVVSLLPNNDSTVSPVSDKSVRAGV